jgi:hypothetical protein
MQGSTSFQWVSGTVALESEPLLNFVSSLNEYGLFRDTA